MVASAGSSGGGGRSDRSRGKLIKAAKALLWERGYAAVSPRDIQKKAGVGQGSFYHHFDRKADLAGAALAEVAERMKADLNQQFDRARPPLDRVRGWLDRPRDGANGCRLGRLAFDAGMGEPQVREPVAEYLIHLEGCLVEALAEALRGGDLKSGTDVEAVAEALIACVQGGYVVARAQGDPDVLQSTLNGARVLLEGVTR
ncbi:MAG: TetR/AcrR family transcriptional regulator [Leptospirillia bacterium]